jgi:hypothetical protein
MHTHTRCPHKGSANTSRNVAKVGRGDGVTWGQKHRDLRPPHNNPARLAGLPTSHTPLHGAGSQYITSEPCPEKLSPIKNFTFCFSKITFKIMLTGSPNNPPFRVSNKICYHSSISYFSHACYILSLSRLPCGIGITLNSVFGVYQFEISTSGTENRDRFRSFTQSLQANA